jgi:anti-sigma factor RsiW
MMTRKRWHDTELSAYLDGALTPQEQAALEAAMARDPDLHRRVEGLRSVTLMMRAMPMHQTPRNYLLTPVMVAGKSALVAEEDGAKPVRRRRPLWAMRLATSVVAAAFVISFGLTLLQQGLAPNRMMQSDGLPSAAVVQEDAPATGLVEAEQLADSAAARMEPKPTLSPEDERTFAPMTESVEMAEAPAEGEGYGEGEPAVEDPAALPPRPPETPLAVEETVDLESPDVIGALEAPASAADAEADTEADVEALAAPLAEPELEASEVEKQVEVEDGEADGAPMDTAAEEGGRTEVQTRLTTSVGITIGLGIATALLTLVTLWISRRQAR